MLSIELLCQYWSTTTPAYIAYILLSLYRYRHFRLWHRWSWWRRREVNQRLLNGRCCIFNMSAIAPPTVVLVHQWVRWRTVGVTLEAWFDKLGDVTWWPTADKRYINLELVLDCWLVICSVTAKTSCTLLTDRLTGCRLSARLITRLSYKLVWSDTMSRGVDQLTRPEVMFAHVGRDEARGGSTAFPLVSKPVNRVTDFTVQSILARPDTTNSARVRNPIARQLQVPMPGSSRLQSSSSGLAEFGSTLVERYIYSLPEYRVKRDRRNFIEICSFNGLLATRKVIGIAPRSHY